MIVSASQFKVLKALVDTATIESDGETVVIADKHLMVEQQQALVDLLDTYTPCYSKTPRDVELEQERETEHRDVLAETDRIRLLEERYARLTYYELTKNR